MGENNGNQKGNDQKNKLEWTVFAISLLLVMGVLGYWSYKAFTGGPTTPEIYVEQEPAPTAHDPYRYHVVVFNKGGQTAESATIEVALQKDGKELEKAELQISFVPNSSKREGWVNFTTDPARADTVVTRVVSYKKP